MNNVYAIWQKLLPYFKNVLQNSENIKGVIVEIGDCGNIIVTDTF